MEGPLLTWLGAELYTTESAAVARDLVASQRTFQDMALSLAVAFPRERQAQAGRRSGAAALQGAAGRGGGGDRPAGAPRPG